MILKNNNLIFFLFLTFIFSCVSNKTEKDNIILISNIGGLDYDIDKDSFDQIITLSTGINSVLNGSSKILLKTRNGCSQTGFYLKESFYNDFKTIDNLIIASTIDDLKQIQNNYFNFPYLDSFSNEYFDNNYLGFVIAYYTGSWFPKDERIIINNGKYYFEIEYWRRSLDDPRVYISRAFNVLYIFEIIKK